MGKFQLEYDALNEIAEEFGLMNNDLKSRIKATATKIGNQLKSNTEIAIPRGKIAKHDVHMADDVKLTVRTTDTKTSITVKGGTKTGSLWFIVDNGHVTQNGKFIPGANFTNKAYNATDVEGPVNTLIKEVLHE